MHVPRSSSPPKDASSPPGDELRQPRSRYRSLSDPASLREFARNLREGIYITMPDGRILDANPAFLEMFGVQSLSDLRHLTAFDLFVDPKQRELEMKLIERSGSVKEFEFQIKRPDGEVRWVRDTSYLVT